MHTRTCQTHDTAREREVEEKAEINEEKEQNDSIKGKGTQTAAKPHESKTAEKEGTKRSKVHVHVNET